MSNVAPSMPIMITLLFFIRYTPVLSSLFVWLPVLLLYNQIPSDLFGSLPYPYLLLSEIPLKLLSQFIVFPYILLVNIAIPLWKSLEVNINIKYNTRVRSNKLKGLTALK